MKFKKIKERGSLLFGHISDRDGGRAKEIFLQEKYSGDQKVNCRAIASLPAVLLLGGIIIDLSLAGILLAYYLNNTVYGTRLAGEARITAQAGLDDGILKVILDKTCPNVNCPPAYPVTVGTGSALVTICKDTCSGTGTTQITSVGRVGLKRYQLIAILAVNQNTGQVQINSIRDVPL